MSVKLKSRDAWTNASNPPLTNSAKKIRYSTPTELKSNVRSSSLIREEKLRPRWTKRWSTLNSGSSMLRRRLTVKSKKLLKNVLWFPTLWPSVTGRETPEKYSVRKKLN